jgi:hypothetical protein
LGWHGTAFLHVKTAGMPKDFTHCPLGSRQPLSSLRKLVSIDSWTSIWLLMPLMRIIRYQVSRRPVRGVRTVLAGGAESDRS